MADDANDERPGDDAAGALQLDPSKLDQGLTQAEPQAATQAATPAAAPATKRPRAKSAPNAVAQALGATASDPAGADGAELVECRVTQLPGREPGETVWQRPADADEGAARGFWEIVPARSGED